MLEQAHVEEFVGAAEASLKAGKLTVRDVSFEPATVPDDGSTYRFSGKVQTPGGRVLDWHGHLVDGGRSSIRFGFPDSPDGDGSLVSTFRFRRLDDAATWKKIGRAFGLVVLSVALISGVDVKRG